MKLSPTLVALAVAAYAIGAANAEIAPNVAKNLHVQAATVCQSMTPADTRLRLRGNGLALVNQNPARGSVKAACSPLVDVSKNGSHAAGLYVSNNDGNVASIYAVCTATYNTASIGPRSVTKSVTVPPGTIRSITWNTGSEFVPFGGPVAIVCELPYKAGVMRVFTIHGNAS